MVIEIHKYSKESERMMRMSETGMFAGVCLLSLVVFISIIKVNVIEGNSLEVDL